MSKKLNIIKNLISIVIIVAILFFAYKIYKTYNFNDFQRAEYKQGLTEFKRDSEEKSSEYDSYKLNNINYNDAMIYKEIEVNPNTPYKVTCKIKTENVVSKQENTDVGAHICIAETTEKSNNIVGTTDWTEVTFCFNSKNRTKVKLGFRLGGYEDEVKGTAWFSDMKIESGIADTSNEWNCLCLLFDNVDANVNGQSIKLQLTQISKEDMNTCIKRFKTSMEELSRNKIKINCEIKEIEEPIKTMSYDEENGYYVSGHDVRNVVDSYIDTGKYDHIFVAFRSGDINTKTKMVTTDWIGLGSMEYRGIGFSNVRLPEDDHDYVYKYDVRVNTFPEEVYVHEFLHTLERNAKEYGYERPELHSNSDYGYNNEQLVGLKKWYKDYMNKEIKTTSGNIGLPPEIFTKKPAKTSDFEFSHKLNYFDEPNNIIEELNDLVKRITKMFSETEQIENTIE